MKKHAIIPLFIPHMGCPHDCVFCNQTAITAMETQIGPAEVCEMMESRLHDLEPLGLEILEAAFYGGSFTGLPLELQKSLLDAVYPYKVCGRIQKIRLSTRPDYINPDILDFLRTYSVDIIELGVQSFDDNVLALSERGHTVDQTMAACRLVRECGFSLGIQLMVGLPGDTKDKALLTAKKAVEMEPDFIRIYPTMVLAGSTLADMLQNGTYSPLATVEAIDIVKEMVRIFDSENIPVIRIGLKSTDNICTSADLSGGYHPAFRQLVEGALAFDEMLQQIETAFIHEGTVLFTAHPKSFSNLIGHKGVNKARLKEQYPHVHFIFKPDVLLPEKRYLLSYK